MISSMSPCRWAPLLGLVGILLSPLGAPALGLSDVAPLYFDGVDGFGTSPGTAALAGETPAFRATPQDAWLDDVSADPTSRVTVEQTLGTVHQDPAAPSLLDPIIADSTWRITNRDAGELVEALLVFTSVDPLGLYPAAVPLVGIDGTLVDLVEYSFAGVDYLVGATLLGDLSPGEFVDITVRYIVAGPLAPGSPPPLPPLGLSVLGSYTIVPEPSTAALVGLGLVAFGIARRRSDA